MSASELPRKVSISNIAGIPIILTTWGGGVQPPVVDWQSITFHDCVFFPIDRM